MRGRGFSRKEGRHGQEPQSNADEFIRVDWLSERVALPYWPGLDRRCNLVAIRSQKGLVIIDTGASPRVMAPMKAKIEQTFHRSDWAYGGQERNIKNLWRILSEDQPQPPDESLKH